MYYPSPCYTPSPVEKEEQNIARQMTSMQLEQWVLLPSHYSADSNNPYSNDERLPSIYALLNNPLEVATSVEQPRRSSESSGRYSPYPTPASSPRISKARTLPVRTTKSRAGSRSSSPKSKTPAASRATQPKQRSAKAQAEFEARASLAEALGNIQNLMQGVNPAICSDLTPLKSNNIPKIPLALTVKKIELLTSNFRALQDFIKIVSDEINWASFHGFEDHAQYLARCLRQVGNRENEQRCDHRSKL